MIPLYKFWVKVNMIGTFNPLIIPAFFGYPFYIILMRQFMLTIPDELLEAAKIDGCNSWQRFITVIVPLSKPGIATISIFSFLFTFSDFLGPLLYANNQNHYTMSLGLQAFMNEHSVDWTSLMAAATLFIVPTILLFLFAQKYFIEGISTSGLK
jgi:multiple sugar transport system permease protein